MDLAKLEAETLFELGLEDEIVLLDETFGVGGALGPDDGGAVAFQRQGRERSGRQEMLLGAAVMRALMRHCADDSGLAVLPVHRLDAGHVAQARTHAVGGDKQACLERTAIGEMHCDGGRARIEPFDRHALDQVDA